MVFDKRYDRGNIEHYSRPALRKARGQSIDRRLTDRAWS